MSKTATVLGEGQLTWSAGERRGDRYGAIWLEAEREGEPSIEHYFSEKHGCIASFEDAPVGEVGTLKVEVLASRQSGHIGDLFHGFSPPKGGCPVGEVELGHGTLFREEADDLRMIGVKPDRPFTGNMGGYAPEGGELPAERDIFWLDPEALYKVHEQTVRVLWDPDDS